MLTADALREIIIYDPATGDFRWRKAAGRHGRYAAGSKAGYLHNGYWMINIANVDYKAHRLAWLYIHGEWPAGHIDHKDLDRANNTMANLRVATRSQNGANRRKMRNNTSGVKGVNWHPSTGKWRAAITVGAQAMALGYFTHKEDAARAYADAAAAYYGEFARIE